MSYNPKSFIDLKAFASIVPNLFIGENKIPESIHDFLSTINFEANLTKIRKNSTSETHFEEVFYKWFNAFKVLKYMHFARDNYFPDVLIFDATNGLLELIGEAKLKSNKELLLTFRAIDLK